MITNFLLQMFYSFLKLLLYPITAMGDVVLNSNIHSSISTASAYLANMNIVMPISTILAVFGLIVAIETFILLYKAINWLIRKIPTIS